MERTLQSRSRRSTPGSRNGRAAHRDGPRAPRMPGFWRNKCRRKSAILQARGTAGRPDDDFSEAAGYCPRLSPAGGRLMQLYLVRHGIAVDGGEAMPDGSRGLTDKGRRRFHRTARAFGKLGHKLDLILTSPLVRAVQTAEILAGATKHGEVAVLEELDPKFDVATLRTAVAKRARKSGAVALVGHEPQLSLALAALSGVSPADIDLKKGAIVRV